MELKFVRLVRASEIPEPQHNGHRRQRENKFNELFQRVKLMPVSQAAVIEHDAPAPQVFHARLRTALKEHPEIANLGIIAHVRGKKAYITKTRLVPKFS